MAQISLSEFGRLDEVVYSCPEFFLMTFVGVNLVVQCVAALFFMARDGTLWRLPKEWSFVDSLTASASPAAIYALQNTLLQLSYRNLDSLTFSLLNQTKLVFTAFFMFLLLGYVTFLVWVWPWLSAEFVTHKALISPYFSCSKLLQSKGGFYSSYILVRTSICVCLCYVFISSRSHLYL